MTKRFESDPFEVYDEYFEWLCELVNHGVGSDEAAHHKLFWYLHGVEFSDRTAVLIPNDDNRIADTHRLRREFVDCTPYTEPSYCEVEGPSSLLEVMIALARRMNDELTFDTSIDDTSGYFWELLINLGLDRIHDPFLPSNFRYVMSVIDALLDRKYDYDGKGGFFPLKNPRVDQTKVEIWDQMAAYLEENYPV